MNNVIGTGFSSCILHYGNVKCLLKRVIETKTQFPPLIMELKILKMESLEHEKSHTILPGWTLPVIFEALNLCLLFPASNKKTRVLEAPTTMVMGHIQVQIVGTELQTSADVTCNHSQTSLLIVFSCFFILGVQLFFFFHSLALYVLNDPGLGI